MAEVFGVEMPDLPEELTVVEVLVVAKAFGPGGTVLCIRYSTGLTTWEAAGMAIAAADGCRDELRGSFEGDDG